MNLAEESISGPIVRKFALRLEGDLLGTRFFQTNQWSPKVSAGIVYKF